jgi:hypothetical protein
VLLGDAFPLKGQAWICGIFELPDGELEPYDKLVTLLAGCLNLVMSRAVIVK